MGLLLTMATILEQDLRTTVHLTAAFGPLVSLRA